MLTRLIFCAVTSLLVALGLVLDHSAEALSLADIFADNMVLQRDQPIQIWGKAAPLERIELNLAGTSIEGQADDHGNFLVQLPPQPAGGPHTLTARGSLRQDPEHVLHNILIGDVWLSSGQSNMEQGLGEALGGGEEITTSRNPWLRLFNIARAPASTPSNHIGSRDGRLAWYAAVGASRQVEADALRQFSAVSYFFGNHLQTSLEVPVGLINAAYGGTTIETWTPAEAFEQPAPPPQYPGDNPGNPSHLYNGMVHPLARLAIKGVIWYQGESNLDDGLDYQHKLVRLINSWRRAFGNAELPFYFVQIAPYRYQADPLQLCRLWLAQSRVDDELPHTGMVISNDVGDLNDIHPRAKRPIGVRLANLALAQTYGYQDLLATGPTPVHLDVRGQDAVISFQHAGLGLMVRSGERLNWFATAGANGIYHDAAAEILGANQVLVKAAHPDPIRSVRFACDQAAVPNLINSAGLPTGTFVLHDHKK